MSIILRMYCSSLLDFCRERLRASHVGCGDRERRSSVVGLLDTLLKDGQPQDSPRCSEMLRSQRSLCRKVFPHSHTDTFRSLKWKDQETHMEHGRMVLLTVMQRGFLFLLPSDPFAIITDPHFWRWNANCQHLCTSRSPFSHNSHACFQLRSPR